MTLDAARVQNLVDAAPCADAAELSAWMWMTKGMDEYRRKRYDGAAEWLARARDGYGPDAAAAVTAHAFLAMSHWRRGQAAEAAEELRRSIARAPDHPRRPGVRDLSIRLFDSMTCTLARREAERLLSEAAENGTGG